MVKIKKNQMIDQIADKPLRLVLVENKYYGDPGESRSGYLLSGYPDYWLLQAPGRTCMYLGYQGVGKCD